MSDQPSEQPLVWEIIKPGVATAPMEPTEDGWTCVAVRLTRGVRVENLVAKIACKVTIASGRGVLVHSGETKNYQELRCYVVAKDGYVTIERAWEETVLAVTWPPIKSAVNKPFSPIQK